MTDTTITEYCPKDIADWERWLEINHLSASSVWLVYYKKASSNETISWSDAVNIALCYGWIDSKKQTIDEYRYRQYFSKRKENSVWSRINKDKVQTLIDKGLMKPAGYESIAVAKLNGSWTKLDAVENLDIPLDMQLEFNNNDGAKEQFLNLSRSKRKAILQWIVLSSKEKTRQNRINTIIAHLKNQTLPKSFR